MEGIAAVRAAAMELLSQTSAIQYIEDIGLKGDSMSYQGPNRRKRQFIDRKHQLRFALSVVLFSFLLPLFFLCLIISPVARLFFEDAQTVQSMARQFMGFTLENWMVFLIALAFVGFSSVLFSHLIFGPMRRFQDILLQKRENPGQTVYCQLRRSDYFHEFSHLLEEVLNVPQPAESSTRLFEEEEAEEEGEAMAVGSVSPR